MCVCTTKYTCYCAFSLRQLYLLLRVTYMQCIIEVGRHIACVLVKFIFKYFCCIILYLFYHYCYHYYVVNKDFHIENIMIHRRYR